MCNAGYYCPGGNDGPEPPGMECPPGYYCETGVGYPIACPNGTFSNTSKNTELSNCLSCTPGMYRKLFVGVILLICLLLSHTCISCCFEPPGMECPLGYYCPEATLEPLSCPPGTYRDTEAAESKLSWLEPFCKIPLKLYLLVYHNCLTNQCHTL